MEYRRFHRIEKVLDAIIPVIDFIEDVTEAVADFAYEVYVFLYDKRNKRREIQERRDELFRKIAFCEEGELDDYLRRLEELN